MEVAMTDILKRAQVPYQGRGMARGEIVLRHLGDDRLHPYVVHFHNLDDGGFYFGNYARTREDAEEMFADKCELYRAEVV
jgi:hypothetical protein